jgi:outer membrane protein assembly factor BamB
VFTDDGKLQIYHSANGTIILQYQGRVLTLDKKTVTTKTEFQTQPSGKPELITDYSFVSDARLKIGWGGVFYLELNRQ